jgi:hypothetical protein
LKQTIRERLTKAKRRIERRFPEVRWFFYLTNDWKKSPGEIIRTGRQIVYRLLSWNPWQHVFFRLLDQLRLPMRC